MIAINLRELQTFLPHRYPFLLVDRVIEVDIKGDEKRIVGLKNVTINEPFFNGHFPGHPIMPGVMMVEALAQISGVLTFSILGKRYETEDDLFYFAGIDNARFKYTVTPGDQLRLESKLDRQRQELWKFSCTAHVGEQLACSCELMIAAANGKDK